MKRLLSALAICAMATTATAQTHHITWPQKPLRYTPISGGCPSSSDIRKMCGGEQAVCLQQGGSDAACRKQYNDCIAAKTNSCGTSW